jgi:hypothetical protein
MVPVPRQANWVLNGIAASRNRVAMALNQLALFKCELLHVSRRLDANRIDQCIVAMVAAGIALVVIVVAILGAVVSIPAKVIKLGSSID